MYRRIGLVIALITVALGAGACASDDESVLGTTTSAAPVTEFVLAPQRDPLATTSVADLCRAYDAAAAVTVENGGADRAAIGPALRHLADLAYTFPDAAVREDAGYVQSVAHNGYTAPRDFYGSTVAISTRCR
ncbi:MAG TPA: hypothetical protein DIW80_01300 [Gordonia polyisoprenivorans]|nr:hypothetical protein [Gordonia polyisoprenivorans]HCS56088.1 hypothetical protein [Gordonia polyisoprenivorans]